ncbi:MAG: hypothetical protein EA398_16905, partial [Deltaproteobacteria bacterium]
MRSDDRRALPCPPASRMTRTLLPRLLPLAALVAALFMVSPLLANDPDPTEPPPTEPPPTEPPPTE